MNERETFFNLIGGVSLVLGTYILILWGGLNIIHVLLLYCLILGLWYIIIVIHIFKSGFKK